jgi:hypothetical protein
MSNNDACKTATIYGSYTPLDHKNAVEYTINKWRKKRCDELSTTTDVKWIETFDNETTSYYCPPGLTGCYQGKCYITSKAECEKHSFYPYTEDTKGDKRGTDDDKKKNYLEWRVDNKLPELGQNCYLGNSALKQWCISPESRNPPDSKAPPFAYDKKYGVCYLTKAYCDNKGFDWNGPDSDIQGDFIPTSYNDNRRDLGGKCHESTGMEIAETLFGSTLTRGIKSGCLSDKKYKKNIRKLIDNFAGPGINLYYFDYIDEVKKIHPEYKLNKHIGYLSDEIKKVYPELIIKKQGREYIDIKPEFVKEQKYRRIINTLTFEDMFISKLKSFYKIKDE